MGAFERAAQQNRSIAALLAAQQNRSITAMLHLEAHRRGRRRNGRAVGIGKTYFWCTCGASAKQPFCDGSHKGTDFKPTKKGPKCDGSHSHTTMAKKPGSWGWFS